MNLKIASQSAKKVFDISTIVDGDISWTTERVGVAGQLEFNLIKEGDISYLEGDQVMMLMDKLRLDFDKDALLEVEKDGVKGFRGQVFKKVKSQQSIKTTCYDQLYRLRQCKQSYNIKDMNVKAVIEMIAKEYGFTTGYLEPVSYILPKKLYDNQPLLDIIVDCVSRTGLATGKIYNFYDEHGKLVLKKAEDMKLKVTLGNKSFATDYTYTTTLENTYNYIKLVQDNENTGGVNTYIVKDSKTIDLWGILQYYEKADKELNAAQLQERAKMLFDYYSQRRRRLKLTAIGVAEVRAGSMVRIDIAGLGDINLDKLLLVEKCTHKISSAGHLMDLEMEVYNG